MEEKYNKEISKYTLYDQILNSIIEELIEAIKENKNLIVKANKIDIEISRRQIIIEELIEIVNNYRNTEINLQENESKIIVYRGDPYLTIHLCMQALTQRTKILLVRDEFMLGVNEILLKIIIDIFKNHKITGLIYSTDNYSVKEIEKYKKNFKDIVVLGDTTMSQLLEKKHEIKYYPYYNILLYCDDSKLSKLEEAIYIFSNEYQYEIEILYEDTIDEAIEIINLEETSNIAILLTNDKNNEQKFRQQVKNKEIFVNENPFKNPQIKKCNYLK